MSLENYLKNKIPFSEACSFLVEFHKLGEDMAMAQPAPAPDTIGLYAAVAQAEFKSILAYTIYGQTLRDLAREGLAEEFQEHADDELEHAEFVLRRMAVLGGTPPLQDVPMPPPASDPVQVVQNLIQIEQEGIAAWQALHAALGEDPAKYKVEEYLAVEQEHLDDMLRLLPEQPAAPAPMEAGAPPGPAAPVAPKPGGDGGASVKVDLKPGGAGEKVAFAERMLAGTERYYSDRMLSVLQRMPAKVYTPEGALDGVLPTERFKTAAIWLKKYAENFPTAPAAMDNQLPPQQSTQAGSQLQADPRTSAWLQNEMDGQAAQGAASEEFYKQRFMAASQQLEAATQQAEQAGQQAQQLQQQMEQSQMAISSAQNQAQQATALAMEQVMHAGDEKLQQQMQAAQMRMAFQDMRGQLMNLASQEPPTQVLNDPAAMAAQSGLAAPGTQAMGGQTPPATQPQDAASAPAGQAPDAQAQPGQPGPGGSQTPTEGSEPSEAAGKGKGSTSVTVKQGFALQEKTAAGMWMRGAKSDIDFGNGHVVKKGQDIHIGDYDHAAGGVPITLPSGVRIIIGHQQEKKKTAAIKDHALGAGLGALVGGAGTAFEASGHGDAMRDDLKNKINTLEQEQGSFPQAMRLVGSKFLLAGSEAAKEHPVGASIMGSLAGAGIGAATEPAVRSLINSGRRLLG